MAEKGFGVKEVNLIGASGTPTITSPNNLNLNANNVAISTNVSIGGTLSVTGNVSVGGTLTYEDVTNIDSVGLITARSGVVVGAGKSILVGAGVTISSSTKGDIQISGIATANSFVAKGGNVNVDIGSLNQGFYLNNSGSTHLGLSWSSSASSNYLSGTGSHPLNITNFAGIGILPSSGACSLGYAGSGKLQTTSTGVNVTGAITVNGAALSIDPTNSDVQVAYTVTANGASAYRFAGNGVVSTADNPDLYLIRGQKYRFINNSGGSHPFQIREASGGTAYSTGVTNNGASSGNIDFAPTYDSPAQLVYQCTSHGSMVGNIYLRDAAGNNVNVGVTTFIGHVQANNIKLDRGSATEFALRVDTTSSTGASRISFDESGTSKGQIAYSHDNDQVELIGRSGNGAAIITDANKTGLKIDTNGYVTKPLNVIFHAFGGPNSVSQNTDIVFGQERFDIGSNYNTSTGEFTAPVAGYYHLYAQVYRQNGSDDSFWGFYLDTGSGYTQISESRIKTAGAAGYSTLQSSLYWYMSSGHKIKCRVPGSSGDIHCNNTLSYFCGNLVG